MEFAAGLQTYTTISDPNQGIGGLTPAEMAGLRINFTRNVWMTMTGLASEKKFY
jgi:hypothetical protein